MFFMKMNLQIQLPVTFIKEAGQFVAYTPALELCTSGATLAEAQQHFDEIVRLFLEEVVENGTLDEVLTDLGWEQRNSQWIPPEIIAQSSKQFSIPFPVE